ncbi:hypothetical protein [Polymorphum gilvum]|uniref:Uncharacterized protein n=1 Tax=Polymorphum gilvum (strain LMG 25793 / CGMCC 1.9160 / SL003B-26A1) TaxID=991905 RepID=F2IUP7_POLGS|nr:hypothetical protein [Polymorphum gilvum]ADZ69101.1 hypothetical protein SL003B_0669 [Polymorphum gilvum SL003B-26A1]
MQEVTMTRRFTLERDTTLAQATAATMKAVEAAFGGIFEQTSDGSFSGTGRAFPQQQRNAFDRKTGAEVGYNIKISGKLKDHGNGEFSAMVALTGDGANTVGRLMKAGSVLNIVVLPVLGGVLSLGMFRGALFAGLIGAGIGLALALAIASAFRKLPEKAMHNARAAVEGKLAAIEFQSAD